MTSLEVVSIFDRFDRLVNNYEMLTMSVCRIALLLSTELEVLLKGYLEERIIAAENPNYTYNPQKCPALALGIDPQENSSKNPKHARNPREFPVLASSVDAQENSPCIVEATDSPTLSPFSKFIKAAVAASLKRNMKVMKEEKHQMISVRRDEGGLESSMLKITTKGQLGSFEAQHRTMDTTNKNPKYAVEETENIAMDAQSSSGSSTNSGSESEVEDSDPEKQKSPIENELLPLYDTIREIFDGSKISIEKRDLVKKELLKVTKMCHKYDIAFARLQGNYEAVLKNMKTCEKKIERERETMENYREKYIYLIEEMSKERQRTQKEDEKRHELGKLEKVNKIYNEFITEVTHLNKEMYQQPEHRTRACSSTETIYCLNCKKNDHKAAVSECSTFKQTGDKLINLERRQDILENYLLCIMIVMIALIVAVLIILEF